MKALNRIGMAGALTGMLAFGGCAATNDALGRNQQTWTLNTMPEVPAAQGKVKVANEKNGNHDVKVEVQHLATPAEVFQGTTTYVVWLTPANGQPQNVGVLQIGKDKKGELKTQTAFTSFNINVTAENDANATAPSGRTVLNARVEVAT